MLNFQKNSSIILYKIYFIGLLFASIFLFLSVLLYSRLQLLFVSFGDKLETLCGCTNHFSFFSHPFLYSFLLLTALGIVFFACFGLAKVWKLKRATNKFVKVNLKNKKSGMSGKLKQVVKSLGLEGKVFEINNHNPDVFCFGFVNSKICISSAFVKSLNKKELRAVLLHEQYHLITHETVKIFIIKTITAVLFFVPGLKTLARQYFTLSEVSADEWSIKDPEDKIFLAGAIYKTLELKEKMILSNSLAIASFNNVTEERVERMVDDNYRINIKIFKPRLLMNIFILSFVLLLSFFTIYSSKSAIAGYYNDVCSMDNMNTNNQCQMLHNGSMCKMYLKSVLPKGDVCNELLYSVPD